MEIAQDYIALLEAQAAHSNTLQGLRADVQRWRSVAEQALEQLQALQQTQHIDTRIVEHLRAGDGTYVLAEHTADGLTILFTPTVAALREQLLADLHRVDAEAMEAAA